MDYKKLFIEKQHYKFTEWLAWTDGWGVIVFQFFFYLNLVINRYEYMNSILGKLFMVKNWDKEKLKEFKTSLTESN